MVSPPASPEDLAARFLEEDCCAVGCAGPWMVSGTYAYPGALMEVEFGRTSMWGIMDENVRLKA